MNDSLRADLAKIVGGFIAVRRKKRDWSLGDLAGRCAVSRQSIHHFEHGHTLPAIETLYRIAHAFEIDVCDLLPSRRDIALD